MTTLVIGDVHGCADELETLLTKVGADRVVFVGDLFTKGPDPAGVWRLARDAGASAVMGNHDDRLIATIDGRRPDDKGAKKCIKTLDAADPAWQAWTRALPLFLDVENFIVVHAMLHPSGDRDRTTRDQALFWRRWPDDNWAAPHWWNSYTGPRPVIFGHDARQGLVRKERDEQPYVLGLDTGCVYGGKLTGYIIEKDELVQIPARKAYKSFV